MQNCLCAKRHVPTQHSTATAQTAWQISTCTELLSPDPRLHTASRHGVPNRGLHPVASVIATTAASASQALHPVARASTLLGHQDLFGAVAFAQGPTKTLWLTARAAPSLLSSFQLSVKGFRQLPGRGLLQCPRAHVLCTARQWSCP